MSATLNRRHLILGTAAAAFGLSTPVLRQAFGRSRGQTTRVLFYTKSAGFQHSVIARKGTELGHAERILTELGREHNFEVVCSKDGRLFEPDKIGEWDLFAFYTTGDLTTAGNQDDGPPMTPAGKQALLDAIAGGKGFVGFHSATDSFHSKDGEVDPYIQMIGGEFVSHGAQQVAKLVCSNAEFPGVKPFAPTFELNDEWYAQRNLNPDLHVVLYHDTKDMEGPMYQRPNFPQTWARMQGKGRVFYNSMGHREDVWENAHFQGLALGGMAWACGRVDADVTPNVAKTTPEMNKLP